MYPLLVTAKYPLFCERLPKVNCDNVVMLFIVASAYPLSSPSLNWILVEDLFNAGKLEVAGPNVSLQKLFSAQFVREKIPSDELLIYP